MSTAETKQSQTASLPTLQPGDQMHAEEFERRYLATPNCRKAELIEGCVYVPSPARLRHGQPHGLLMGWVVNYAVATPGTDYADNATNRLDSENELQPDVALFVDPSCGGQTRVSEDGYLTGAAEFVAEVSVSSVALDRGPKLRTYQRHGVKEYLIWRVDDQILEWYRRSNDQFELIPEGPDGVIRSSAFPGLWLNSSTMLQRDGLAVMQTLQAGLADQHHAEFVQRLENAKR